LLRAEAMVMPLGVLYWISIFVVDFPCNRD
jgi:hypothetical protein